MTIPSVTAGDLIAPAWGNSVADALNTATDRLTFTGSGTNDAVAAAGWDVQSLVTHINVAGTLLQFVMRVQRTGATIAAGNPTNQLVATLPERVRGSISAKLAASSGEAGTLCSWFYQPNTGKLDLASAAEDIPTNGVFDVTGFFVIAAG